MFSFAEAGQRTLEATGEQTDRFLGVERGNMPDAEASLLEQSLHNKKHAHSSNDKKQSAKEGTQIVDLTKMSVKAAERCLEFQSVYGNEALKILMDLSERHEMLNPLKHPKEPYVRCWEEKWMPTGKNCRDVEGEEMVRKLAEFLKNKKTLFEDPIFAADNESLFADPADAVSRSNARQTFRKDQDEFLAGVTGIEWKRPNEWGNPSDEVVIWDTKGGIDPDDGMCPLLTIVCTFCVPFFKLS